MTELSHGVQKGLKEKKKRSEEDVGQERKDKDVKHSHKKHEHIEEADQENLTVISVHHQKENHTKNKEVPDDQQKQKEPNTSEKSHKHHKVKSSRARARTVEALKVEDRKKSFSGGVGGSDSETGGHSGSDCDDPALLHAVQYFSESVMDRKKKKKKKKKKAKNSSQENKPSKYDSPSEFKKGRSSKSEIVTRQRKNSFSAPSFQRSDHTSSGYRSPFEFFDIANDSNSGEKKVTRSRANSLTCPQFLRGPSQRSLGSASDEEGSLHLSPRLTDLSFEMSKQYFLEFVLKDIEGRKVFMQFLKKRHCAENLMFWVDAERYKDIPDEEIEQRKIKAQEILKRYLSADSPYEINISGGDRAELMANLKDPKRDAFTNAQSAIFLLMVYGTFDYFIKTERFRLFKVRKDAGLSVDDFANENWEDVEADIQRRHTCDGLANKPHIISTEPMVRQCRSTTSPPALNPAQKIQQERKPDPSKGQKCIIS